MIASQRLQLSKAGLFGHRCDGRSDDLVGRVGFPQRAEEGSRPSDGQLRQLPVVGGHGRGRGQHLVGFPGPSEEVQCLAEDDGGVDRGGLVPHGTAQPTGQGVFLHLEGGPGCGLGDLDPAASTAVEAPERHPQGITTLDHTLVGRVGQGPGEKNAPERGKVGPDHVAVEGVVQA